VAFTMAVNAASRRVMEKSGLAFVQTFHEDWPDPILGTEQGEVEYAVDRADWERRLTVEGSSGRDRDAAGRPRNARPRDELGRPLPRDAAGVVGVPDEALPPAESLAEAQRLLDAGHAFHAHEVLEGTWKAAPASERELWRGLAQLAVGLTHIRRGNAVGAVQLLRRASDRIDGYADGPPYGIDAARLAGWARDLAERVERDGVADLRPEELTARLRA
jgi:uncharacterized protein